MPEVSVIIPFYNRIIWAGEAVQSVLLQTFQDFEIILVDDGSTDDLYNLINIKDRRIRYVRQKNKGPASARNLGVKLATGNYIAFLDADDLFLPEKLKIQYEQMANAPKALLSHTSYSQIERNGELIKEMNSGLFSGNVYPEIILGCPIATPTVMVRRDVFDKFSFEESIRVGEDIILWAEIAKKSSIVGIDIPLTKVRIHGENAAFDCNLQVQAAKNRIDFLITNNSDISIVKRRVLTSSIYFTLAKLFFDKKKYLSFSRYITKALISWPLNYHIYKTIAQKIFLKLSLSYKNDFDSIGGIHK